MGISRYNPAYVRRRYKFEQKYNGYSTVADPFKIVLVSPKDINRYTTGLDERYWTPGGAGLITNGDWDKEAKFIRDMTKYKAVQKRTQEKIDLEDTGIIDKIYYEFCTKEARRKFDSKSDFKNHYQNKIDKLYDSIKENEYDEQNHGLFDYVGVHVGRDGEFIFSKSGNHRLSICKFLDVDEIPVHIRARHKLWQEIREDIYNNGFSEDHDHLRDHPDLQDVIDG